MPREGKTGVGAPPRRRLDVETTPGRCSNLDYCSIGSQRILLKVPLSQPFACPECAGPLRAPRRRSMASRPVILPMLRLTVLAAAVAMSLGVGYMAGRARNRVGAVVTDATASLGANLHVAKAALGLAPAAALRPVGLVVPGPAVSPAPVFVSERTFPAHLPSVDVSKPPARLAGESRFGQVTLDCLQDAGAAGPKCQVTDIRGADPFSAGAVVWLQSMAVHYGPALRSGVATSLAHRWRVVLEDFSGTALPGKVTSR